MSPSCGFNPIVGTNSSNTHAILPQPLWNGSSVLAFENHGDNLDLKWLCWGYDEFIDTGYPYISCDRQKAHSFLSENGTWYLRPMDTTSPDWYTQQQAYPIKYCLSEDKVPERCQLQYVSTILAMVVACNLIKVIAMVATVLLIWDLEEPIFATVGDAVASYLERPDEHTAGWCLIGRKEIYLWRKGKLQHDKHALYNPPKLRLLISATSKFRYLTTMGLCTLYLAAGIALWFLSVKQSKQYYSMSQIWALGLGDVNENTTLQIQPGGRILPSTILILNILIANSFQVALSTTYFLYNSLYTAQCAAIEWTSYTLKPRPLRVTHPRGQQRSTYWLQLPLVYGLVLIAASMLMHFLISQAIFLARVQWYDLGEESTSISELGYSPVGILASCCVGGGLLLFQLLSSLRPLKGGGIPLHGNESCAISAACHPPTDENDHQLLTENMALSKVMWGAVLQPQSDKDVGHCSFTSGQVEMPERGKRYQ